MTTPEKKEKNQKYILDNLDKYVIDSRGNFVSTDFDTYGTDYFFISKDGLTLSGYNEIIRKIVEGVLREKEKWELNFFPSGNTLKGFRHKQDGREVDSKFFDFETYYKMVGELGYRENVWEKYEEIKKAREENDREWEKWCREHLTNNSDNNQPTSPKFEPENQENQNPTSQSPNQPNNPKPNQPKHSSTNQDKPTSNAFSNPLPTPTDIQNQYNSDKAQAEIANNPNLTDTQTKQQAQELLKLIITAELLLKESKTNSEILTKISNLKKQNSPLYQTLNKEKRIDKVISQLEKLAQKNNPAVDNSPKENNNSFPTGIILLISFSFLIIGIIVLGKRFWKRKLRLR